MGQRSDARPASVGADVRGSSPVSSRASAWIRRVLTVCLIGALVSPAIRNHDSLPLSTYPMYSSTRTNVSSYATATGFDRDGNPTTLSALTTSQSRDRLIAQAFLNDAVRRGEGPRICAEILARSGRDVARVEIATERHDTIARLKGEPSLLDRDIHATCEVTP